MHGSQETLVDDFLAPSKQHADAQCKILFKNSCFILILLTNFRLYGKLRNLVLINIICKDSEIYVCQKNFKAFFLSFNSFLKTNEKGPLFFILATFQRLGQKLLLRLTFSILLNQIFFLGTYCDGSLQDSEADEGNPALTL